MKYASAYYFAREHGPILNEPKTASTDDINNIAEVVLHNNLRGDGIIQIPAFVTNFPVIINDKPEGGQEIIPLEDWDSKGYGQQRKEYDAALLSAAAKYLPTMKAAGWSDAQVRYCADTIAYLTGKLADLPGVQYRPIEQVNTGDGRHILQATVGEAKYELTATGGGTAPGRRIAAAASVTPAASADIAPAPAA